MTALIAASQNGHTLVVEKLLEGGANVNLINNVRNLFLTVILVHLCPGVLSKQHVFNCGVISHFIG